MKRILRVGESVKSRRAKVKERLALPFDLLDLDVKLQLIQELIPLGLLHIQEVLEEEVRELAGERYRRNGRAGYDRWGKQWGSVYLGDQKLPIPCPRVRDTREGGEVRLSTYEALQHPRDLEGGVLKKVLHGISCRRYQECSRMIPEVFGLSPSTVSRRFIQASRKKLKELTERRLDGLDIVVLLLDGKTFREDEMIVALGITLEGQKIVLGVLQAGTENAGVCKDLLRDLLERGLEIEEGLLCVIDGSKGLRKAIEEVLSGHALVQRCQYHKRENVIRYLPKTLQESFTRSLQKAYERPTYEQAKEALTRIKKELSLVNESAVRSLEEGLEETLTLHRLGLFEQLGRSLKTTNCIESVMARVEEKTSKVDCWKNSSQKQRWLAATLLDMEPRFKRLRGYRHLPALRMAIQRDLGIRETSVKEVIAA